MYLPDRSNYDDEYHNVIFNLSYQFRNEKADEYIFSLNLKEDSKLPLDSYAFYTENIWNMIKNINNFDEMIDLNLNIKKNWILNYKLEEYKNIVHREALQNIFNIKKKICKNETVLYMEDYGQIGYQIYKGTIKYFESICKGYKYLDAYRIKKEELAASLQKTLYDIFLLQVKELKNEIYEIFPNKIKKIKKAHSNSASTLPFLIIL